MKQIFFFLLLFTLSWAVKEDFKDLGALLDNPDALFQLEKRIGNMLSELDTDGHPDSKPDCNAMEGVLDIDCEFHANRSSIIRTKESLAQNAVFLEDISNVSCARDCTALCCDHENCDTAVYQDKDVHNCYLFKCGSPSTCVFAEHADYWMSSISKDVHNSHSLAPGAATVIHENELQNLGSDSHELDAAPPARPTTVKTTTTTSKPGLGERCASYSTKCNDSHAECLMGSCTCRVGYHEKHGICRKHCRDEEFECENVVSGVASRQCVHKSYLCDGSQDCADGSDEYRCPDKDKPAYLDMDSAGNLYNSPLYNLPYGNQPDTQYPYGFPIPGLSNQKQAGLLPANQIYANQLQQQPAGGFYLPVQGQAGSQAGSQLTGQWPFGDKAIGSPLYQNGIPYQTGQQPAFIPQQQQPSQTGYIPVAKQAVNPVQQVNTNLQPVQPVGQSQSGGPQYTPVNTGQIPVMPQVNTGIQQPPAQQQPAPQQPAANIPQQTQNTNPDQSQQVQQRPPVVQNPSSDRAGYTADTYDDTYQDYTGTDKQINDNAVPQQHSDMDSDVNDLPGGNDYGNFYPKNFPSNNEHHRHSEEEDGYDQKSPQAPVTPRPKTAEQTTVLVKHKQNKGKPSSEGYLDYSSWIGYDSDSPRINGKKGPSHKSASKEPRKTTRRPPTTVAQSKDFASQQGGHQTNSDQTQQGHGDRYNTDNRDYNRYPTDGYRGRFDDFDRPAGGGGRRPGYDRYPADRFNSGNRHRPSHGSRYPFYESGYPRGRDRNPYPVWDPMKAEYYYPEDYEDDKDLDTVPGMDNMGAGHRMDYMDVPTDDRVPNQRPPHGNDVVPKVHQQDDAAPTARPVKTEAPVKPVPVTQAPVVTDKVKPDSPQPSVNNPEPPAQPKNPETDSQEADIVEKQTPQSSGDKDKTDTNSKSSKTQDNQSTNKGNSSGTQSGLSGSGQFKFLNVESVEVDSYTDNSQGPIVALSLGLAITVVLLIFVGCRLRTVKRRLRKGRALHSNEADYLINGMYL